MTGRWFSTGNPVSSTNKTDRHDITEILLKVALTLTFWKTLAVFVGNFLFRYNTYICDPVSVFLYNIKDADCWCFTNVNIHSGT